MKKYSLLRLSTLAGLTIAATAAALTTQVPALAWVDPDPQPRSQKAPIAISGDNVYIVWFTDKGTPNTNGEVIFRASNDAGATFADKINLSNTNDTDSINAELAAEGDNVLVTW